MFESFLSLKRKVLFGIIAKVTVLGLSVGAFASFLTVMIQKLTLGGAKVGACTLIGIGCFLAVVGSSLLICFPTEKRIARFIDKRLSLNEKVETMVAFKNEDGEIITAQREQTDSILKDVKLTRLIDKKVLFNLIAPIIATTMVITALSVTPKEINAGDDLPPPVIDPEFDATKIQIQELEDLIKYVKDSNMEKEPRALVVDELEKLLDILKTDDKITVSQMKEKVSYAILETKKILDNANTNDDIAFELNKVENKYFITFAASVRDLNSVSAEVSINSMSQSMPDTITKAELKELLKLYSDGFKESLVSSGVSNTDVMYLALFQLASKLGDLSAAVDTMSMVDIQRQKTISVEDAKIDIATAFIIQVNNKEVADTVVKTLMEIFNISNGELPEYEDEDFFVSVELPDDKPSEDGATSGGYGDGEKEYAGNDKVYDPETGNFVEYGVLIDAYLAKVTQQIKDGIVPDTLEQFISDYFTALNSKSNQ